MSDFERFLEAARVEREAVERKQQDVFLNVIDRARMEAIQRAKEDPMLMWDTFSNSKREPETKVEVLPSIEQQKNEAFMNGFVSGALVVAALVLMALIVWWVV